MECASEEALAKLSARGAEYPIVMCGLLRHEQRHTVMHAMVRRKPECERPIKSKEPLTMQCGFRRWPVRPIFSEATKGCDKHKFERFLQHGVHSVVSAFGPASFGSAPVLLFRGEELVASGSALPADVDRVVLKRIVLSGYPLKVHKKSSTVRYMFFFPEDIRWFKPIELHTKCGRTGHIKAPLGTHCLMKCTFDRGVAQNDTVCMNLYKRVYPKGLAEMIREL